MELQCNLAVSYILSKKYNDADELLRKLISPVAKIHNKDILNIVFRNYCLNKLNLTSDNAEKAARAVLLEYKTYLNMNNYQDYVDYMNLEIDVLRGTGASTLEIEENINDSLLAVSKLKLSNKSKAFYDASVARMVWAHRTSPELCLEMLDYDLPYLKKLPVPEKYYAFKHIDLFFRDLRGDIVQIYGELKKAAHQYMANHALHDMTVYFDALPINAIRERAAIQMELVSLLKADDRKYNFDQLKEKFETAIDLCKDNHLHIIENKYRLNLIDEATSLVNFEKNGKLKYHTLVAEQLAILEEFVPNVGIASDVAEFGARMACYYYCIGNKEKFISSFNRYEDAHVNRQIFAPWLRGKILVCAYLTALYKVETVLKSLSQATDFNELALIIAVAKYLGIENAGLKLLSIDSQNVPFVLLVDLDNQLVIDIFHKRLGSNFETFFIGSEGMHPLENTSVPIPVRYIDLSNLRDEKLQLLAESYYLRLTGKV